MEKIKGSGLAEPPFLKSSISQIIQIANIFEGSIEIEPSISEDRVKDFRGAYSYIMQTYKPYKNIKPCIAYVLLNGVSDGWRVNSISIAYECLRVYNGDLNKAFELAKLYYENSYKKPSRTLQHLRGALYWISRKKGFKVSCNYLSANLVCIGSKEKCNEIRGIKKGRSGGMELLNNQKASYLKRFTDFGYYLRLTPRAMRLYFFLLEKYFNSDFEVLYISQREMAKGIGIKDLIIKPYLKELARESLIAYVSGKPGLGSNKATEIKLIDITGRTENRADMLLAEAFKN